MNASMSPWLHASHDARTISTFSCDIAYSRRPGGFDGRRHIHHLAWGLLLWPCAPAPRSRPAQLVNSSHLYGVDHCFALIGSIEIAAPVDVARRIKVRDDRADQRFLNVPGCFQACERCVGLAAARQVTSRRHIPRWAEYHDLCRHEVVASRHWQVERGVATGARAVPD